LNAEFRIYDHLYSVSADGLLLRKGKPYTAITRKDGYQSAGRRRLVHRMVAEVWIRPIQKGEAVHHINHVKGDNRAVNLEITTRALHMVEKHPDVLERIGKAKMSEAGKQKLRELRTGSKQSEETKRKIGDAIKRLGIKPPVNRGPLPAHVIAWRRENPSKAQPCIVNGIQYKTFKDAAKATGIKWGTIRKRCHSPNFPEFQLVTFS